MPARPPPLLPHELRLALLAAFFSFAPIGFLIQIVPQTPGNWPAAIVAAAVSGLIAVSWASAFIFRKYWTIALIVPATAVIPPFIFYWCGRIGIWRFIPPEHAMGHRIQLSAGIVACIVVGYVLLHRFIGVRERRLERAQAELDMAAQIHKALVPPLQFRTPRLEAFGLSSASGEMGGDLLDAVVSGSRVDFCVADVSGHGVKAGVVMGLVKGALRMRLRAGGALGDLARDLNTVLGDTLESGMFVTAAWLRFDASAATIAVITGHPPVFQFKAATGEVLRHDNDAFPLGIAADPMVGELTLTAAPGDVFLVYTDGIVEVFGPEGEQFGYDRIAQILAQHGRRPLPDIYATLLSAAAAHGPQFDDQTVLLVRVIA